MASIKETSDAISTLRKMSSKELAVTIFLVISAVVGTFWIENRYAKLVDTQEHIQKQQTEIIQLQTQILNVVNSLPPEVRKEIVEKSRTSRALDLDSSSFIKQR